MTYLRLCRQPWAITVKKLEPVTALPKRLHTAFCWGGSGEFVENPARNLSSAGMYRKLGFTVVPQDGAESFEPSQHNASDGGVMSPKQRTGSEWTGMKLGLMFGGVFNSFTALKASVAATKTYQLRTCGYSD